MKSLAFEAIGTHWDIDLYDPLPDSVFRQIEKQIRQRIDAFDRTYSRFRDDSLVRKIADGEASMFPEESRHMLELFRKLYQLTDGAFTPLIGTVLEDAGYDSSYSFKSRPLQTPPELDGVLELGKNAIQVKNPVLFDFGALGKGALIDEVGSLLKSTGVHAFCIDAGGDMLYEHHSKKPLRIGLEHPEDTGKVIGVTEITKGSICASSGNRRRWGTYHHLMHPHTRQPVNTVLSSWIIADTAMLADCIATAVFFTDPERLREAFHFEYLLMYPDHTIRKSPDFPGELYYTRS